MAERTQLRIFSEDWVDATPGERFAYFKKPKGRKHKAIVIIDGNPVGVVSPGEGVALFFGDDGKIEAFEIYKLDY